ncbi:MAG: DUF512 domain-containing protein [Corallococcus sp.]|nr:DUF512 domain-containing protein [Corallococcus sp.]MCM1359207.1 DUF512 domain-containing protein [Corallococcus sp.]MCM1394597.1 DUF512 domain-containing protein [Corallococcus sp.]
MLKISNVEKKTVAQKVGIRRNDEIVAFCGEPAADMLDVAYYDSLAEFDVTVLRGKKQIVFHVEKDAMQTMGWNFYDECYIEPRWCANKCVFCFVDQLPEGQRKTLYVKDDDWRLSFVSGNFVTLTNVSDKEIERIESKKFSPLYVSVHATDEDLRKKLLGNPKARPILPLLTRLANSGITMFTQIVMCPNLNDGKQLEKTLKDLYNLYPAVQNVAIVPVGLTKHRNNLCDLAPMNEKVALKTIDFVEKFDADCFVKSGKHFAYCSDEMYLYAKRDVPEFEYYGDFEQLENGVGLIADFRYQFNLAFSSAVAAKKGSFTVVTGVSATPLIKETINKAKGKFSDLNLNVVTVKNNFFGETVTVAGLIVGRDILAALADRTDIGDTLLLPRVMLRETEDVFLDGMTLGELKKITGKKIIVTADGYEFCEAVLECE